MNCGKWGHTHLRCRAPKVVRCLRCGAANVRTKHCPCQKPCGKDISRIQNLRRVRTKILQSVTIHAEIYEAIFAIDSDKTKISMALFRTLKLYGYEATNRGQLVIPITIGEITFNHMCFIEEISNADMIIGMDLLDRIGFSFSVGGERVNHHSPIFNDAFEIRIVTIQRQAGTGPDNAMREAVHKHNEERLKNPMEVDAMHTLEELESAIEPSS